MKLCKIKVIFKLGVRSPRFAPDVQTISPNSPDEFNFETNPRNHTRGDFTVHTTHSNDPYFKSNDLIYGNVRSRPNRPSRPNWQIGHSSDACISFVCKYFMIKIYEIIDKNVSFNLIRMGSKRTFHICFDLYMTYI